MNKLEKIGVVGIISGYIGLLVFLPVIIFGFGYFGGIILKWIVGDLIVNGLNIIFNTTRFNLNLIPIMCATLAIIGGYLKPVQASKK